MITYITALYPEAKELITALQLKQNHTETLYQLFEGEDVQLLVTGAGMISAAAATSRHFANYPSRNGYDLVVNLGLAGYHPGTTDYDIPAAGSLFFVSKITELCTGRTFYPDLLYRNPFPQLPLVTSPVVADDSSSLPPDTLVDMEASALYQVLLPHISPERMLFIKVVSDILKTTASDPGINPAALLKPHMSALVTYITTLHQFLRQHAPKEMTGTEADAALIRQVREQLPLTETMDKEFQRLLSYARLSRCPLHQCLEQFLSELPETAIRGKKQAMPYLSRLRDLILNETAAFSENSFPLPGEPATGSVQTSTVPDSLYRPFFSTVYAEKEAWSEEWEQKLNTTPIYIRHYKDLFNRSHQNFAEQKKAPSLILARKTGNLIYQGAPVCQNFGNQYFYYTSCMMNCIYHCDYCYLQGMYPSGHVVVFVNLEDYFAELETLLNEHPVYLCISYDTDLLALEQTFSFVSRWLSFAASHPDLTLEIRTKSGNPAIFKSLASLFDGREHLKEQIIFAWTVSPEQMCETAEHGAASLFLRIKSLLAAKIAGFSVRLCFDPVIFHAGWKESYARLVKDIFLRVPADCLYDVSIGVFRISTEYLKNMRRKRPDSAIVQYPYITEQGVSHYGALSEELVQYVYELLLPYIPAEKIFVWNGGL